MSGPIIEGWEVPRQSLRRKGREADLTDVPVLKLAKAAAERGIRVDLTRSGPGGVHGEVEKIIVAGDDEAS